MSGSDPGQDADRSAKDVERVEPQEPDEQKGARRQAVAQTPSVGVAEHKARQCEEKVDGEKRPRGFEGDSVPGMRRHDDKRGNPAQAVQCHESVCFARHGTRRDLARFAAALPQRLSVKTNVAGLSLFQCLENRHRRRSFSALPWAIRSLSAALAGICSRKSRAHVMD
jgi:hypothetical protein